MDTPSSGEFVVVVVAGVLRRVSVALMAQRHLERCRYVAEGLDVAPSSPAVGRR